MAKIVRSRLRISQRVEQRVAVLDLVGALDRPGADALLAAVGDLSRAGIRSIVCNLQDLAEVSDPALLMVFPAAQPRAGRWPGHAVHLAGAATRVGRQLQELGVDRFLSVHPTVDEALLRSRADDLATYRELELESVTDSPGRARRLMADVAAAHQDAALVLSELTTNAVRHAGGSLTVTVAAAASQLLIGVTDPSRREPVLLPLRASRTGGRGIRLVQALSDSWGVRLVHDGGKTVWARLAPDGPGG